jgi:dTDP-4-amino-4,6-dideoxygalactose transaminase
MKAEGQDKSFRDFNPSPLSFSLPPSSFPIVPLAAPHWNAATYRAIVGSIFSGATIDGPDLTTLASSLGERLGVPAAVLCGSGSLALELALRACGVGAGDEVIIPAFCCSAVVPPILAVGAVPVLADVGTELNLTVETVDQAITRKTRAVIVAHLFGNPAEIEPMIELAGARNIRVIDDAAQALGATLDGRPVGGFGDAGVLSFGREKVCFGLGGGAVVTHRPEAVADLAQTLNRPPLAQILANAAATLLNWRWRRWTRPLQRAFGRGAAAGPAASPAPYRQEAMANLQASVASSLVQTLAENIVARRTRVRLYRRLLGGQARLELIAHRSGSACLTQVVRVLPSHRQQDAAAAVIGALGAAGYEVQGSYVPIHLLGSFPGCVWDRLSYAERIWSELVELPCEPGVSLTHVERIAAIVKRVATGA